MFTGIIQKTSSITHITENNAIISVTLRRPSGWSIVLGESIAINGVCSTVAEYSEETFTVQYMPETLRKTTVSEWRIGDIVNLEKSLRVGDSLDGHFVMGHVDTVGHILAITHEGDSQVWTMQVSREHSPFIVKKGSVTLDGISLTVSDVTEETFQVSLIPYTLTHTHLHTRNIGDSINVETDILGKYILKNHYAA